MAAFTVVPMYQYDDVHTTNAGANAPMCRIIVHIACVPQDCDSTITITILGFDRQGRDWIVLASGPVRCQGPLVRHELDMAVPLPRQEIAVIAVFKCGEDELRGDERRIFAVCDR